MLYLSRVSNDGISINFPSLKLPGCPSFMVSPLVMPHIFMNRTDEFFHGLIISYFQIKQNPTHDMIICGCGATLLCECIIPGNVIKYYGNKNRVVFYRVWGVLRNGQDAPKIYL